MMKEMNMDEIYCIKCGEKLSHGAAFCLRCGQKVIMPEATEKTAAETSSRTSDKAMAATAMAAKSLDTVNQTARPGAAATDRHSSPTAQPSRAGANPAPRYHSAPSPSIEAPSYKPMTIGDWIITWLILLIPVVNIVMPFVWAFGSDTQRSKKTFFQAILMMTVVSVGLVFVFSMAVSIFAMAIS